MGSNRHAGLSRKKKNPIELVAKDGKQNGVEEESKKKMSASIKKKRRRADGKDAHSGKAINMSSEGETIEAQTAKKKDKSSRKKKRKNGEINDGKSNQLGEEIEDGSLDDNDVGAAELVQSETRGMNESSKEAGMLKKSGKKRKGHIFTSKKGKKSLEQRESPQTDISFGKDEEAEAEDIYYISSGDDDCSKGMKKWIVGYHQSRPGLKVLQERIDEFITAHEAQFEQERKEREARAAEGGWTVVVHHKGRKKTTDSESGVTVGSVAQAVVEDKMTKKKHKEAGLDFYRFQRREAQRNEIMMLQSKFEQDKKRIQQLRAARKFRPY